MERAPIVILLASSFSIVCSNPTAFAQTAATAPPIKQANASAAAAIQFASGSTLEVESGGGRFPLIAANAAEKLTVQLRFVGNANKSLVVQPLDGGSVSPAAIASVAADGTASLQFQPGNQPGLYRVLLIQGDKMSTLQFWVADPQRPEAGPPALKPSTGS